MSRDRIWFLVRFLLAAGLLFALWDAAGLSGLYARVVLFAVSYVSPLLTGYQLEIAGTLAHVTGFFVRDGARAEVPLNLHESLAGVVPFLALIVASFSSRRRLVLLARATAIGLGVLYAVQVVVVSMLPWMVTAHAQWINDLLDIVYVFAALGGLVALPFLLWFVLVGQTRTGASGIST